MTTETLTPKETRWVLAEIWNAVAFKENRPIAKRDYVYASELNQPLCDRYLKMKGVAYTNPPNNRSLRKFLMGGLVEHVVKQILIAAGVYKHDEIKVDGTPYPDCLSVHGRADFVAGGYIDGEEALGRLNDLNLPENLYSVGRKVIESLEGKMLEKMILELKSVSSFAMDRVERARAAIPGHTLQAYHYQRNAGIKGSVVYISKDDCRMAQFLVKEEDAEPLYRKDLEQITYYFNKSEQPKTEPLAKWDELLGKFSKHLGVEYSPYLSMLYNFADPDEYRKSVKYIDGWNRVLSRYVLAELGGKTPTGKFIEITKKNKECREEIEKSGYDFKSLLECKIRLGAIEDEEEITE